MSDKSRMADVKVGIFVLVALAIFISGALWIAGSTFLGGCFAAMFWVMLDLLTNLWMFFWCMLLFCTFFASKIYQLYHSRFSASFWLNVAMTMLIVVGPAVEDSADGKDVYAAFFSRMGLFIAVTLYAWLAVEFLEYLRSRRRMKQIASTIQ